MATTPRVLMIGLDAADCSFIEQHLNQLPHIAAIAGGQHLHRLKVEPLSGAVWSTFNSEKTPDEHGNYHHMQWDSERMTLRRPRPDWIDAPEPFWRDIASTGKSVTVFDVPFVFKGDSKGAVEIANWGSHDLVGGFWGNDSKSVEIVRSIARLHPMGFEVPVPKTAPTLQTSLRDILAGIPLKVDVCRQLFQSRDSDLFIVAFGETHRAGHLLWPEPDEPGSPVPDNAILEVYQAIDKAVGQLVDAAGPDAAIVLFALHGMGPNQSQSHLSTSMLQVAMAQDETMPAEESSGLIRALRRNVPPSLQHSIAKAVPVAVRDFVLAREVAGGHDWSKTPAISLQGDLSGYWRANVKDRESQGIIEDLDAFLENVAAELKLFTTEDGAPLVERVSFPTQDWTGQKRHFLPDIVAEWYEDLPSIETAVHPSGARIKAMRDTGRSGNHRFCGFCVMRVSDAQPPAPPGHIKDLGGLAKSLLDRAAP